MLESEKSKVLNIWGIVEEVIPQLKEYAVRNAKVTLRLNEDELSSVLIKHNRIQDVFDETSAPVYKKVNIPDYKAKKLYRKIEEKIHLPEGVDYLVMNLDVEDNFYMLIGMKPEFKEDADKG